MLFLSLTLLFNGILFYVSSFQLPIINKYSYRHESNCIIGGSLSSNECDDGFNFPDSISRKSKTSLVQYISSLATFSTLSTIAMIGKVANAQEPPTKAKKPKVLEVQNFRTYISK